MSSTAPDKQKAVDSAIGQIERQFGKGGAARGYRDRGRGRVPLAEPDDQGGHAEGPGRGQQGEADAGLDAVRVEQVVGIRDATPDEVSNGVEPMIMPVLH